ncbi:GH25 family lysozyme [Oenococcus oeni]|uniref:1,4-beta-N-acetylmuramidase n=2 Tax=Oenococcus oeni TaxID=1247 RepID=A0A6N4A8Q1_OENOE|nr:GH25 family lysozyme [Oenococcus oeni]KGO15789.1 1,4-beta-N-acetylmuramidase [Oenococcus oeni X2L]KGH56375.1 1,4-beta-N-acetylmuramidase [Oenococcus oeni S22]KGH71223.1 1,4-beta-N-acetylmuramidase [Oenococcus oeni S25]KGH74173.1 1,4-beta-N-acetylmuramidase [Oenococcus oeni IOEB_0502]KGH80563.1 1,4-beta-N-acetylmuramidase [Oenococcus oeni IOEB_0607]
MQKKRGRTKKNFLDYIFFILLAFGLVWTFTLWTTAKAPARKSAAASSAKNISQKTTDKQDKAKKKSSDKKAHSSSSANSVSSISSSNSQASKANLKKYALGTTLSSDQPYTDYSYLKSQNIRFVYFRSTTGNSSFDNLFLTSIKSAKDAGLSVGSMTIYDPSITAYSAYLYFVRKVGKKVGNLPIAVYVTDDSITDDNSITNLLGLLQDLKEYYPNNSVIVRCDKTVYDEVHAKLASLNLKYWLIENNLDGLGSENQFVQYNANGKVGSGMRSFRLPLSVFDGSKADLKKLSEGIEK